ncbi:isoaspartyl peptidase/L-asparaginase [Fulvivirgaceae bacterium BMA12]|uniref:Isoaspartyl peptidase/L-asparaginase n=1 Tax=Agaribacillus aureus TaxID=3051825 RepID=A0ABT8LFE1_9BACT|nr:isoaspartyl peptidase/L-asparaginase [Fulvivirgaceae bacterium BMA12]
MKRLFFLLPVLWLSLPLKAQTDQKITLAIHGGAGTILKENMTPGQEEAYRQKLQEALVQGYAILEEGGTSLEAIVAAIRIMEDSPLFNAGKGAVFTNEKRNELDAAIMDGKTGLAGAVAGVTNIKNPITAALAVMNQSRHVMMGGAGAEKFAKEAGLEMVDPSYFYTEKRFNQLQHIKKLEKSQLDHDGGQGAIKRSYPDHKFGTVGAVALDQYGNLAAGTSTGGMTNKRYGRIGDTPIIGAGTYASNDACAVSATGHGEFFIRSVVAYDVAALMKYKGLPLQDAAEEVVMKKLVKIEGSGGIIAVDKKGNIAMPFNTAGMYRGYIKEKGKAKIFIYEEE